MQVAFLALIALASRAHGQGAGMADEVKTWAMQAEGYDERHEQTMLLIIDALTTELTSGGTMAGRLDWQRPAELLAHEGSKHPLIAFAVAYSSNLQGKGRKASGEYKVALQALTQSAAPAGFRLAAATRAAAHEDYWGTKDSAKPYHVMQRDLFLELLSQGVPEDHVESMTEKGLALIEYMQPDVASDLAQRVESMQKLDPWLREMIAGAFEVRAAWDERGVAFAHATSREQMERFAARLERAHSRLSRAWQMEPARPHAATRLISVTMGGGSPAEETCHTWFNRATAARPDYEPAFRAMLWAMRPRWGGSHSAMHDVGKAALIAWRFDTQAPMMYAQALLDMLDDGAKLELLATPAVRARLNALAEGYAKASNRRNQGRIDTLRMIAAAAAKDYESAAALLAQPAIAWDASVLGVTRTTLRDIAGEAMVRTGPFAEQVAAAESLMAKGLAAEAASAYAAILASPSAADADPKALDPILDRKATADIAAGFATGEWTEIRPDPSLFGWSARLGFWRASTERLITGGNPHGPLRLACKVDFGSRYEVRAKLSEGGTRVSRAEIALLLNLTEEPGKLQFNAIAWCPNEGQLQLSCEGDADPIVIPVPGDPTKRPRPLDLLVQVWDDSLVMMVAGKVVYSGDMPRCTAGTSRQFALGTRLATLSNSWIQVSDLAFRKLAEPPAALSTPIGGLSR